MKKFICFVILLAYTINVPVFAQSLTTITDTTVAMILHGNYNPASYMASTILNRHDTITNGIISRVSPDSLHATLNVLGTFGTRNSGSDTVSSVRGIGAARRWVYSRFNQLSAQNENRLKPAYLQFDYSMCSITQHRDIIAVLPGMDTTDKSVIIIEGHLDSRCAGLCDTASVAKGIEDNGSGTALVLELARVMSKYSYNHTIVFMVTTGEEQGLYGAQAFANYAHTQGINIKAVLNNDVIGGIICGHTSSPPSCPGYENIDSTHVRLFSYGGFNSFHKGLARYVKLEYNERVRPTADVPMTVNIMTPEDRTGRGGDHIPFREQNFTAIRFTAENEDGDADVTDTSYTDRQHTSADSIGIDVDGDGIIDTFYENFDYLARNTIMNGNAAGMMAIGPQTPDFSAATGSLGQLCIHITAHPEYLHYKAGVRSTTYDWDSVYEFTGSLYDTIILSPGTYITSVASVDSNGVESLFSEELATVPTDLKNINKDQPGIELLQNKPNPADEVTAISVLVNEQVSYQSAYIVISDLQGNEVSKTPISLNMGMNEILYRHGYNKSGTYIYTLVIEGKPAQAKKMVFAY